MALSTLPFPTGLADNEIAVGIRLTPFADYPRSLVSASSGAFVELGGPGGIPTLNQPVYETGDHMRMGRATVTGAFRN